MFSFNDLSSNMDLFVLKNELKLTSTIFNDMFWSSWLKGNLNWRYPLLGHFYFDSIIEGGSTKQLCQPLVLEDSSFVVAGSLT